MGRRKGELTPARIDREWPHQVSLPAARCTGVRYDQIEEFCKGLSRCARGHSYVLDRAWHRVFCFSDPEHAERFRQRFEGERFDPSKRGRGRHWSKLRA